jgi:hypothetical protein
MRKMKRKETYHSREPYGHLNLTEEPGMFLASEQKKINGKLSGSFNLDFPDIKIDI